MAPPKSIIAIGVTPPPELQARIDASAKQAREAGYDLEMAQIETAEFPSELEKVKERLRSKPWDGVVVGFGVRGNPKLTDIFEGLVNAASEILPGVKFGFASSPEDAFPCITRNFAGPD